MIIEGYLFIALCLNWPPMVFPSIKQDYGMKFMVTSHIWYPRGSMYGAFTYMKTIKPNCRHIWHAVILCVWEYVFIFSNPSNKKTNLPSLKQNMFAKWKWMVGILYCNLFPAFEFWMFWPIFRFQGVFLFFLLVHDFTWRVTSTDKGLRLQDSRGESSRLWMSWMSN